MLGAIPLVRRAVKELRERGTLSLFPFLAGTCILALFAGETLTALEVIWVTDLSMLLEDYVADRSRREIRKTLQVSIKSAFILRDGREVEVAPGEMSGRRYGLDPGGRADRCRRHRPSGEALVGEAHITGRAEGCLKERGRPGLCRHDSRGGLTRRAGRGRG